MYWPGTRVRETRLDETEVYYAQLMYLVASEEANALRRNREAGPAVDRVDQPRAEVIAQMGMDGGMPRACRWMACPERAAGWRTWELVRVSMAKLARESAIWLCARTWWIQWRTPS
jgi:hypothetical protein